MTKTLCFSTTQGADDLHPRSRLPRCEDLDIEPFEICQLVCTCRFKYEYCGTTGSSIWFFDVILSASHLCDDSEPWLRLHYEIDLLDALTCGLSVAVPARDTLPMFHLRRSDESQRRVTSGSLQCRDLVTTFFSAAMVNGRAHIFWNDKRLSLMVFDPPSFIIWRWCTNLFSHWCRCRLKSFIHFITLENSLLSEGS